MIIIEYVSTIGRIAIVQTDDDRFHGVIIGNNTYYCSCIGFNFKNNCKHIKEYITLLIHKKDYKLGLEMLELKIPSSLPYMNTLTGGILVGMLVGQVSKAGIGKTLSGIQMAFDVMNYHTLKNKKTVNSLIIDTEGSVINLMLKHWIPVFNKRYSMKVGLEFWRLDYEEWNTKKIANLDPYISKDTLIEGNQKIIVFDVPSIEKISLLHGRPMTLHFDSGKITLKIMDKWANYMNFENIPLQKIIKTENIQYLFLDSFSALTNQFISGIINFPARHDFSVTILGVAQQLVRENFIVSIVSLHPTINPLDVDELDIKHLGGKSVGHNIKLMLLHEETPLVGKEATAKYRTVGILRHGSKVNQSDEYKINNTGINEYD